MAQRSKREEIAAAAVKVFHAQGFSATSIRDITGAAGAPLGSFYNHYETKEDLAIEAIQRYASSGNGILEDTSIPPLERLRRHFTALRDENVERDFTRGCMLGNFTTEVSDHSEVIRRVVQDAFSSWAQAVARVLTEAQQDGSLRAGLDPQSTAHFILNAWEGTLIESRAYHSADAYESFFTSVFEVFLPALAAG